MRHHHGPAHLPAVSPPGARWAARAAVAAGASTPDFPPLQRAQVVQLACLEPIARGLHLTHWSSNALAHETVDAGIVDAIDPVTVRRILDAMHLLPLRTRYWLTVQLDDLFKDRAEKVLWCYAKAERLARRGTDVVCADEMPNLQVPERTPNRRSAPGSIEQRLFEYVRHGTVNLLTFLVVHTGRMRATVLPHNDATSYIWALRLFRADYGHLRGVNLIHDGGPSHVAAATDVYLASLGNWWRPRRTPAHAYWVNRSELLNNTFGGRYPKRDTWPDQWTFIEHVRATGLDYNWLDDQFCEWAWTNPKLRSWFTRHTTCISRITSALRH